MLQPRVLLLRRHLYVDGSRPSRHQGRKGVWCPVSQWDGGSQGRGRVSGQDSWLQNLLLFGPNVGKSRFVNINTGVIRNKDTLLFEGLIFKNAGFTDARKYRYWDASSKAFQFSGMMEDLEQAPENSVVILHAVAHNPTGEFYLWLPCWNL